jgi:hypothetical protein
VRPAPRPRVRALTPRARAARVSSKRGLDRGCIRANALRARATCREPRRRRGISECPLSHMVWSLLVRRRARVAHRIAPAGPTLTLRAQASPTRTSSRNCAQRCARSLALSMLDELAWALYLRGGTSPSSWVRDIPRCACHACRTNARTQCFSTPASHRSPHDAGSRTRLSSRLRRPRTSRTWSRCARTQR